MNNKSFLTLLDYSKEEIVHLIDFSLDLKKEKANRIFPKRLNNMNIALIFEKNSTRTRSATSVACFDEGAHADFLSKDDIQMGKKESIKDTARVLGKMFDAIVYRGFDQEIVEKLSAYSQIPVINALTDLYHPTQIIADLATLKETFGKLDGLKMTYLGDARNNVANSLMIGCAKSGVSLSLGAPRDLMPDEDLQKKCKEIAKNTGSILEFTDDPVKAVKNADAVYTDVWISMGEENTAGISERIQKLKPFAVTSEIMQATGKDESIFLHCLPASHKNGLHVNEVVEEVFESRKSRVFEQAENRMHSIKAILVYLKIGG